MIISGIKIRIFCDNEGCRFKYIVDEDFCHSCIYFKPINPNTLFSKILKIRVEYEEKGIDICEIWVKGDQILKILETLKVI